MRDTVRLGYLMAPPATGGPLSLDTFKERCRELRHERDSNPYLWERFMGELKDDQGFEAPKRLQMPSMMTDEAMLRRHNAADWQQVDPRLMTWAARFVEALRRRGIPLYVHRAFRTKEQQQEAVAKGASRAVWPRAPHCLGKAVDIVHGSFHWRMTTQEWAFLHKVGLDVLRRYNAELPKAMRLNLVWGGDWDGDGDIHDQRLYDPAHWEVAEWRDDVRALPVLEPRRLTPRGILALHQFKP